MNAKIKGIEKRIAKMRLAENDLMKILKDIFFFNRISQINVFMIIMLSRIRKKKRKMTNNKPKKTLKSMDITDCMFW